MQSRAILSSLSLSSTSLSTQREFRHVTTCLRRKPRDSCSHARLGLRELSRREGRDCSDWFHRSLTACLPRSNNSRNSPPSSRTLETSSVSLPSRVCCRVNGCEKLTGGSQSRPAIAAYKPQDATTNPSLILAAVKDPKYAKVIDVAVDYAKQKGG